MTKDILTGIPVMPTTRHVRYDLGSRWVKVIEKCLIKVYAFKQLRSEAIDTVRDWCVLPEEALQWLCEEDELTFEDENVIVYWPPLND